MTLQSLIPELLAEWIVGGSAVLVAEGIRKEHARTEKVRLESAFSVFFQIAQ